MHLLKDNKGKLIEQITFSNGITEYIYSVDMHKLNQVFDLYGLDLTQWHHFNIAKKLIKAH